MYEVETSDFMASRVPERTYQRTIPQVETRTVVEHSPIILSRTRVQEEPEVEFEYKHKFLPGATVIRSSPRTTTVIEEKQEYDNGDEDIERVVYEDGVEVSREQISP